MLLLKAETIVPYRKLVIANHIKPWLSSYSMCMYGQPACNLLHLHLRPISELKFHSENLSLAHMRAIIIWIVPQQIIKFRFVRYLHNFTCTSNVIDNNIWGTSLICVYRPLLCEASINVGIILITHFGNTVNENEITHTCTALCLHHCSP